MKSKILLLYSLIIFIVFCLTGCTSAPANDNNPNEIIYTTDAGINRTSISVSSDYNFNDSTDKENVFLDQTAGIKLKVTEIVDDIENQEDIFPVQINSNVIVSEEEGAKEWAIERTLFSHGYFVIRRDRNGQVFITKESAKETVKFDNYDITHYLREAGIDISCMTVDKLDMDYYYSNSYLNFRISDGLNSAFFSSRWDETKHIGTIPLNKYNIIETVFRYNSDGTGRYTSEAYIVKNNNYYSLILYDEKLKRSDRYYIPEDIGEIVEFYDEYQQGFSGNAGSIQKLYLEAVDHKDGALYIYQIDLSENAMKKYVKTADWKRKYALKWRFTGDLKHNYIQGDTEGLLVVYGDDGGISGHHDHKYLYGINMNTGEKVWSVYGGYASMNWSLSEDKKNIYVAVKVKDPFAPKVLNIDLHSGTVLWESVFEEGNNIRLTAVNLGVAVEISDEDEGLNKAKMVKVLDSENGNLVWERKLVEDEHLVIKEGSTPGVITYCKEGIRAYAAGTGELKWLVHGSLRKKLEDIVSPIHWVIENRVKTYEKPSEGAMWLAFENGFKLIDLASGLILHSLKSSHDQYMLFMNDENVLMSSATEEGLSWKYSKGFALYSLKDNKVLWSRDDTLSIAAADNDKLFFLGESKISCVDLYTGKTNWEKKFPTMGMISPVVIGNELIVSNGELFSFDVFNGEFMYQEAGYTMSGPLYYRDISSWPTIYKSGSKVLISNYNGDLDLLELE